MAHSRLNMWVHRHRFVLVLCAALILGATIVRADAAGVIGDKGVWVLGILFVSLNFVLIFGDRYLLLWQRMSRFSRGLRGMIEFVSWLGVLLGTIWALTWRWLSG